MRIFTSKERVVRLFNGILAGNGDIYGRMASSHPGAKPSYPQGLEDIVSKLYASLDPQSALYSKGRRLADQFLATHEFVGKSN